MALAWYYLRHLSHYFFDPRAIEWRLEAALSFAPVSLAPARRLTFPDQQQNLQNPAEHSVATECELIIKKTGVQS